MDLLDGPAEAPGDSMSDYLAVRTSFFDRVVVDAIDRGITQIIVTGAGFDGRCLRYGDPQVRWFEVDHAVIQADKRARLERLGIAVDHVEFVPLDVATAGVAVGLADAGHSRSDPSLVLCEGIAAHLEVDALSSLLRQLRERVAPGSRLAISLSVARSGGVVDDARPPDRRRRFQEAAAALGAPSRCVLTAEDAGSLFAEAGWAPLESSRDDSRRQRARHVGLVLLQPA